MILVKIITVLIKIHVIKMSINYTLEDNYFD